MYGSEKSGKSVNKTMVKERESDKQHRVKRKNPKSLNRRQSNANIRK